MRTFKKLHSFFTFSVPFRKPSPFQIWVISSLCLAALFCLFIIFPKTDKKAESGTLNVSYIENSHPIALSGEWEYYHNRFLFSSDFSSVNPDPPIPEYRILPGTMPSTYGYGTYRLTFSFHETSDLFSLRISGIQGAARIYIDGRLLSDVGFTSSLKSSSDESKDNQYIVFPLDIMKHSHEIIIQISNFSNYSSGITSPIYFGTQINGYRLSSQFKFAESVGLMSVSILAILLIFILFFKIQMSNTSYLLMYTFIWAFHLVYSSNDLLTQPVQSWIYPLLTRLYISSLSLMGLFMLLVSRHNDYPSRITAKISSIYRYAAPVLIGFTFLLPNRLLSAVSGITEIYLITAFLLATVILISQIRAGSYPSLMLSLSLNFCLGFFLLQCFNSQGHVTAHAYIKGYIFLLVAYVTSQIAYIALQVSRIYTGNARLAHRMLITNKLKSEFISATSHELRTPLHGIINIIDSASMKLKDSDPSKEELRLARTLAKKMNSVIHDLYGFYASAERLDTSLHPVNLDIEVNAVIELFHYTSDRPRLTFENNLSRDALWVSADESRLWEILNNVIGNSVKYTESGTIRITSRRAGNQIHISVTDTGIGMSSKEINHIFDKSVRLENASKKAGGFGYGLYLVRQLVEQMGGSIYVEWTRPDQGTCITFCLNACDPETEYPETSAASAPVFSKLEQNYLEDFRGTFASLLVVDDNENNLHIIRSIFEDCSFLMDCVQSARDALELLKKQSYDIIILDVMMPEMSGFEMCQEVRKRYSHFELPILLLTACNSMEEILTGFWSGANDYVVKPADRIELRTRVFSLITLKQSVKSALDNEILFLQAQIRPHFLYNAFNTISAIALTDGAQASELIDDLAVYLRGCFGTKASQELIPIDTELGIVKSYVRIEQARFGKRLHFTSSRATDRSFFLPPLTIQPLIENAIRHTTLDSYKDIHIQLKIREQEDFICIIITDNGTGIDASRISELLDERPTGSKGGIGLRNVNRRLMLHYGIPLDIKTSPETGTQILIRIPVHPKVSGHSDHI